MQPSEAIVCKFRFLCDQQWDELSEIAGEVAVRYCSHCSEPVFLCTDFDELAERSAASQCVALQNGIGSYLLGDPI